MLNAMGVNGQGPMIPSANNVVKSGMTGQGRNLSVGRQGGITQA